MTAGAVALAAALTAVASPAPAQDPPTFAAGVEAVYVDVFVTAKGKPVLGLTASHFELEDEGVRQHVELATLETVPLSTLLVLDTSESVAGERLAALQAAAGALLTSLRPADQASLLTFNQEVAQRVGPVQDKLQVEAALRAMRGRGATSVYDALYAALKVPSEDERTLIVLFTDGEDNMSWLTEEQVRAAAERSSALVQVVGVAAAPVLLGEWRDVRPTGRAPIRADPDAVEPGHVRALRAIAEATGGRFWEAESYGDLEKAFLRIGEAMRNRYLLRFEPRGVPRPGLHRLRVRLKGRRGDVQARPAYYRPVTK